MTVQTPTTTAMTKTQLGRRELLQRAVAVGAIAAVGLPMSVERGLAAAETDDAAVLKLGNECLICASEVVRLAKPRKEAYRKVRAYVKRFPRWQVARLGRVEPKSWYAEVSDFRGKLPNRRVPLIATSHEEAKAAFVKLDKALYREWNEHFELASKRYGSDVLYDAWCAELSKLDRSVLALSKVQAATLTSVSIKARVIEGVKKALGEDSVEVYRIEDLHDSLLADLTRTPAS
jgi:hypothetical protein